MGEVGCVVEKVRCHSACPVVCGLIQPPSYYMMLDASARGMPMTVPRSFL
jgi:hypothetical protein